MASAMGLTASLRAIRRSMTATVRVRAIRGTRAAATVAVDGPNQSIAALIRAKGGCEIKGVVPSPAPFAFHWQMEPS